MNRCYNCKFFVCQDVGYSNFTVTETVVSCLKNHFEPIEESYSWEKNAGGPENDHEFWKQAETCGDFKEGEIQACFDVDGEVTAEDYRDDMELYEALKNAGY